MKSLTVLLIVCNFASAAIGVAGKPPRPNVLLITSEDNGPELGCYGDPYARTPHLDQLAKEGVRFATAQVPYSVCSPSRAVIFTGLYPHQNGQIGLATHKFAMYRKWPNMVSLLKDAGYRTGIIGKIHVNPESAFPCDFRAFPGSNFNDRPMRKFAAAAEKFIRDGDAPFFLMVNFPDAHFPLHRQQHGLPESPLSAKEVKPLPWIGVDSPRLREFTANYYNCLSRLDTGVGLLLEQLEKMDQADSTLVIYLGDHGAQFSRGKTSVYEAGLNVPLIIRTVGAQSGLVRDEMVSTIDLLPTVLDICGIDLPSGAKLPGRSLVPLLKNEKPAWRDHLFAMTTGSAPALYFPQFSVRDERYKLIVSPLRDRKNACAQAYLDRYNIHFAAGTSQAEIDASNAATRGVYDTYLSPPAGELYDLQADPYEFVNLIGSQQHVEVRTRLIKALRDWRAEQNDPFADDSLLTRFTAEHDEAPKLNYRRDKSFRWQYLEYFPAAMSQ